MARAAALALVTLLLAACQGEPQGQEQPQAMETEEPAAPAPSTLAGEWRVAGIDGEDFNEAYGLALSADEGLLWWDPRCAGFVLSYRIEGNAIRFESAPSGPPQEPGTPPRPVCTIGIPPRLSEVFGALQAADRVETTPANGVLISGPEHSLTLFSQ